MKLTVNGEQKKIEGSLTVQELVKQEVEKNHDRLAVAVNSSLVEQNKWSEKKLESGDEIEIVRPLQGG